LSAVYNGSRSILGGTWLDFDTFGTIGADALRVFGGRIGVVEMDGRLRAAGSMSGMLERDLRKNQSHMRFTRPDESSNEIWR
jgi:hypothetical protein